VNNSHDSSSLSSLSLSPEGVPQDADESQIKSAYRKCALKFHPDKQANKSEEEKKEAETIFKR
jgi:DnaJ-class molecular chaperone